MTAREFVAPDTQLQAAERFQRRLVAAADAREHVWVALVAYQVDPPIPDLFVFRSSAVIGPPEVGCYRCEQPWNLFVGRCKGQPT